MLALILRGVGIAAYAGLIAGLGLVLFRRARSARLWRPVLAGALVRLALVLIAHLVSVLLGQHGIFYGDDQGYLTVGSQLAHAWEHGHLPNPTSYAYVGSYSIGYPLLVAFVVLLTGPHILAVTLTNVLLGAASVYMVGRLAQMWLGQDHGVRAAWLLGVLPTLVWWSGVALKENLAMFLVLAALLAAARPDRAPNGTKLILPLIALSSVRFADAIAVCIGLAATRTVELLRGRSDAVRTFGRAAAVAAGTVLVGIVVVSGGHPAAFISSWSDTLSSTQAVYGGGHLASVPGDVARTFIAPYPWVFTHVTFNWYMTLYPGTWLLIMSYPTAIRGIWVLRERRDLLILLLVTIGAFMVLNAYAIGIFFRQRASIEPLVVLLIIAGAESWSGVVRRAAFALALLAPFTLAQSHSLLVPAVLVLGALVLVGVQRRLSAREFRADRGPSSGSVIGPVLTAQGVLKIVQAALRMGAAAIRWLRAKPPAPPDSVAEDPWKGEAAGGGGRVLRRVGFVAVALLVVLLTPAGNVPILAGIPLINAASIVGLLLVVPFVISRKVRSVVVAHLGGVTPRRTVIVGVLLAIAMVAKLALLVSGAHSGWEACYHPVDAPQLASRCERSFDNPLFLQHATRFEQQLNYGAARADQVNGALPQSNWNLSFFNSLRFNRLQPADYRDHLPFSAVWKTSSARRNGEIIYVSYVGEGAIQIGSWRAVLRPSYDRPATLSLRGAPRSGPATVSFAFRPPRSLTGTTSQPYASLRLHHLTPIGPTAPEKALAWLVDLPLLILLIALIYAYGRLATREVWAMLACTVLALLLTAHTAVSVQVMAGLVVVLAALAVRPSWRMLLFAAWAVVMICAVRAHHLFPSWDTVTYRSAGNDPLTYESFARSVLDTGSLRGGESVFYYQPGFRYILFGLRTLFGDSDALLSVAIRSILSLGTLVALTVACASLVRRPVGRLCCFVLGVGVLAILNADGHISTYLDSGISEWPLWAGLPVGTALLILAPNRRWLLAGTVILGICVTTRAETVPGVSVLVVTGLAIWFVRDRRWALLCAATYLAILALPFAHNLLYGGRAVPFTTSSPINVTFPVSDFPRAVTDPVVRSHLGHQLQGVAFAGSASYSSGLEILLRVVQVVWLLTFLTLLVYWRRSSWAAKTLAGLPLIFLAPFLVYDVRDYYPRHIISGHIMMAVSVMIVAALGVIPLPRWVTSVSVIPRGIGSRLLAITGSR